MDTKSRQIEFDVFPKENKTNYSYLSGVKSDTNQEPASINVIFSHQSVIIIFICVLMSLVASFTLGVEKGKLIAKNNFSKDNLQVVAAKTVTDETALTQEKRLVAAENTQITAQPAAQVQLPVVTQASVETATKSGYTIQVASLNTESSAKSLVQSLIKNGVTAFSKPSGKYIVVLAGNFEKKEEAQTKLRELKKTYTDCFIKKI